MDVKYIQSLPIHTMWNTIAAIFLKHAHLSSLKCYQSDVFDGDNLISANEASDGCILATFNYNSLSSS